MHSRTLLTSRVVLFQSVYSRFHHLLVQIFKYSPVVSESSGRWGHLSWKRQSPFQSSSSEKWVDKQKLMEISNTTDNQTKKKKNWIGEFINELILKNCLCPKQHWLKCTNNYLSWFKLTGIFFFFIPTGKKCQ